MITLKELMGQDEPPYLDEVIVTKDGENMQTLTEGKWIDGRFTRNIRVDRNTHMQSGDEHYHVYGRSGDLIGALKADGSKSHGGKSFKLSAGDADALRALGVPLPKNNIIEWIEIGRTAELLLG